MFKILLITVSALTLSACLYRPIGADHGHDRQDCGYHDSGDRHGCNEHSHDNRSDDSHDDQHDDQHDH